MKNEQPILDLSKIGFKTAFKATMGVYIAQFVATLMGLLIIGLFFTFVYLGFKFL